MCVYLCASLGGSGVSVAFVNRGRERAQSREEPGKKLIIMKLLQHASLSAMVSLGIPLLILKTSLQYILRHHSGRKPRPMVLDFTFKRV